ncbi:MAG: methyltransferase domain-containing protein [Spirochaetales bacterium]|nr:methyltransferase domain-containing protein [Spirochaetales bacterium]
MRTFSTTRHKGKHDEAVLATNCPLCGKAEVTESWRADDVEFVRCATCGLIRQEPQPAEEAILARYDDEYLEYETARHLEYRQISLLSLSEAGLSPSDAVDAMGHPRSMLEIGCATGALLSSFASEGWDTIGVEVGASLAAYARGTFGLDVRTGTIASAGFPDQRFDVVVATHLIEHLNKPRAFLGEVRRVLKPDGVLYLITPNADGLQALIMRSAWRSAIGDHLYLFSCRTLSAMLAVEGFVVEYTGTWGGWPAGMAPTCLKKPLDAMAKRLGRGDVMIVRSRRARD